MVLLRFVRRQKRRELLYQSGTIDIGSNAMKNTIAWPEVRQFVDDLAARTHEQVRPFFGTSGGELLGSGASGDILARIDEAAGEFIRRELRNGFPYPCALLDEKTATLQPLADNPVIGIVIDEIDGTRRVCTHDPNWSTSIAAFPLDEELLLRNVRAGVIQTFTGERFSFQRGAGVWLNGKPWQVTPGTSTLDQLRFSFDLAGSIPVLTEAYLAPFTRSHRYGVSVLASSAYVTTRLLLGGYDFYINVCSRMEREWPELKQKIRELHGGATGLYVWDLATAVPLLKEAGLVATRSDGSSLDDVSLTDGTAIYDVVFARSIEVNTHVCRLINLQAGQLRKEAPAWVARIASLYH